MERRTSELLRDEVEIPLVWQSLLRKRRREREKVLETENTLKCVQIAEPALGLPLLVYICLNVPISEKWRQTYRQAERENPKTAAVMGLRVGRHIARCLFLNERKSSKGRWASCSRRSLRMQSRCATVCRESKES